MLYNKSTGKPVVHDVMSTESLVAWLETMPADGTYEFSNTRTPCLQAQYFEAMGTPTRLLGNTSVMFRDGIRRGPISKAFQVTAFNHPRTFGAALERAKTFLKQENQNAA
jgi:hypothetical protein